MTPRQAALAIAFALAVTPANAATPPKLAALQDDKFSAAATVLGPAKTINPFGGTARTWRLRSFIDKRTGAVTHQIYADTSYGGHWRFWELAASDQAQALAVVAIDRGVTGCFGSAGCNYEEVVGVDIPDALLQARAATGFQIKLSAKSGDTLILDITPDQIDAQLGTVRTYVAALGASAAARQQPGVAFAAAAPGHVVLGVKGAKVPAQVAPQIGAPATGCVIVAQIEPSSVAAKAGLIVGDCITRVGDRAIADTPDLQAAIAAASPGQLVGAQIVRSGHLTDISLQF